MTMWSAVGVEKQIKFAFGTQNSATVNWACFYEDFLSNFAKTFGSNEIRNFFPPTTLPKLSISQTKNDFLNDCDIIPWNKSDFFNISISMVNNTKKSTFGQHMLTKKSKKSENLILNIPSTVDFMFETWKVEFFCFFDSYYRGFVNEVAGGCFDTSPSFTYSLGAILESQANRWTKMECQNTPPNNVAEDSQCV